MSVSLCAVEGDGQQGWCRGLTLFLNFVLFLCLVACITLSAGLNSAQASINDDAYDGNIFVLYGGNGSLVPPKVNLMQAQKLGKPSLVVFYIDDSKDCKKYAMSLNTIQVRYTPTLSIIPVNVDSLSLNQPEAAYFHGLVPQTVLFDRQGKVVFDGIGYGIAETVNQKVYDLLTAPEPSTPQTINWVAYW